MEHISNIERSAATQETLDKLKGNDMAFPELSISILKIAIDAVEAFNQIHQDHHLRLDGLDSLALSKSLAAPFSDDIEQAVDAQKDSDHPASLSQTSTDTSQNNIAAMEALANALDDFSAQDDDNSSEELPLTDHLDISESKNVTESLSEDVLSASMDSSDVDEHAQSPSALTEDGLDASHEHAELSEETEMTSSVSTTEEDIAALDEALGASQESAPLNAPAMDTTDLNVDNHATQTAESISEDVDTSLEFGDEMVDVAEVSSEADAYDAVEDAIAQEEQQHHTKIL